MPDEADRVHVIKGVSVDWSLVQLLLKRDFGDEVVIDVLSGRILRFFPEMATHKAVTGNPGPGFSFDKSMINRFSGSYGLDSNHQYGSESRCEIPAALLGEIGIR